MAMVFQKSFEIVTAGRGSQDISAQVVAAVAESGLNSGLCNVFIHHTSASLMICENADPAVRRDLETFMARIAPDGDPDFVHTAEGPDDMPAHVRSVLTQTGISVPVIEGHLGLGIWQGIYLWEHRAAPHRRKLTVTVLE